MQDAGQSGAGCRGVGCLPFACHWCKWCGAALAILLTLAKMYCCSCFLACPLPFPLCSRCVVLKYAFISQFKAVFSGFLLFGVGLYCLRDLRGLCGFCVRERLGGFGACGVFAFLFVSLPCFMSFCPSLCLAFALSTPVVFCLSSFLLCSFFGCCCFFPFGCTDKKKGRKVLPLASPLVLLWVLC